MKGEAGRTGPTHVPVLPTEVLELLAPAPGQTLVDCTVGAGGHGRLLAERIAPGGRLLGIDQDQAMLGLARAHLTGLPVTLVHANFDQLRQVLDDQGIDCVDSVLADLGVSSDQLDSPERGLSFQEEGPLDMRLDPSQGEPASALIRRLSERALADLFWEYGEERYSRRIARKVVQVRQSQPLTTTTQLAELVRSCIPRARGRRPAIDPATRVFQALRIAVNDELGALDRLLAALPRCLKPRGRAAVISFHSLEDRRVKQTFRQRAIWEELTRRPITASEEEQRGNPRARSAKLRAARLRSDAKETQ
jgi:16S rRNA (cytosine1402-N4)-methyltransferase